MFAADENSLRNESNRRPEVAPVSRLHRPRVPAFPGPLQSTRYCNNYVSLNLSFAVILIFCYFFNMNQDMLLLHEGAGLLGIELSDQQLALFDLYQGELLKWNAKTNLISEKTAGEIVTRHFLDSLTAAKYITPQNARMVDVGCGAGFPGIPLKIALPSIQLYLLETNRKKVSFLKHIIRLLNLEGAFTLHDRTENIVRTDTWQEKFDIVISRAALKLPDLLPLGTYFLVRDGLLIALKGPDVTSELEASKTKERLSKIYQIFQHDISLSLLGPPRKIIIAQKVK
jgi:16S rRNA (guanine527-N7)-methyltransferase